MFKINCLKSSSMGNMFLVESENQKPMFLDVGLDSKQSQHAMKLNNKSFNNVGSALVTHAHQDHAKGIKYLINDYAVDVYMPSEVILQNDILGHRHAFKIQDRQVISFNGYDILPVNVLHINNDGSNCETYNFLIRNSIGEELAYITDCGKAVKNMPNAKVYIIESNYDNDYVADAILRGELDSKYVDRTTSVGGHLSMQECAQYLKSNIGDKTELVLLMHLSTNANSEAHAEHIRGVTGFKNVVAIRPNEFNVNEYVAGYIAPKVPF